MSSTHKEQSVKFQKKKEIRDSRTPARKLLEEAKRILCAKFNIDYDELINDTKVFYDELVVCDLDGNDMIYDKVSQDTLLKYFKEKELNENE